MLGPLTCTRTQHSPGKVTLLPKPRGPRRPARVPAVVAAELWCRDRAQRRCLQLFLLCMSDRAPAHGRGEGEGATSRQGGRGTKILGKPPAKLDLALLYHPIPHPRSCLSAGLRGRDIGRRKSRTEDGAPRGGWEGSQGQRRRRRRSPQLRPGRAGPSPEGPQVYSGGKGSSAVGWSQFSWLQVVPEASMRWNV